MTDILEKICLEKKTHIKNMQRILSLAETEFLAKQVEPTRGFFSALKNTAVAGKIGLIAEVKKASPSKGLIRETFNPKEIAKAYELGGATCISVLTDTPYFQGLDDHLKLAHTAVSLPVIRKDFIIDPYQVVEARALGADCILLILAALDDSLASELEKLAFEWGMDVLVEIHNEIELERAMKLESPLLGINNRNLKTLVTDLNTTRRLAPIALKAERLLVSESGLHSRSDIYSMYEAGARGFLVGESLMAKKDIKAATQALLTTEKTNQINS